MATRGSSAAAPDARDEPDSWQLTWLGNQACVLERTRHRIYFDPWIEGNPGCPISLADISDAEAVVVSHGHPGHFGDSTYVAAKTSAKYVAAGALTSFIRAARLLPAGQLVPCTLGEPVQVLGHTVTFYKLRHPRVSAQSFAPWRPNCGVIFQSTAFTFFHAGDLATDTHLSAIGDEHPIAYAALPLTGHDPAQAAEWLLDSARLLRPEVVIPTSRVPAQAACRKATDRLIDGRKLPFKIIWPTPGIPIRLEHRRSHQESLP